MGKMGCTELPGTAEERIRGFTMSKIRIGQRMTVTHNGRSRYGEVVWINSERKWFALEFVSNYWNPFKNGYDKYLECFHMNTKEQKQV